MKRLLLLLPVLLLLVACGKSEEELRKEEKTDMIAGMHNDYGVMGTDALSVLWNIEEDISGMKDASDGTLYYFTDRYLLDKETYDKMSKSEQDVIMHTSGMISKFERDVYDDEELLEEDKRRLLKLMKHGITQ